MEFLPIEILLVASLEDYRLCMGTITVKKIKGAILENFPVSPLF